jgi:hypothetical protein
MRQSWKNLELITLEDGTPCGISLGFDFCAEHEMGRDSMDRALGLGHAGKTGLKQYLARPLACDDLRLSLYERQKATKTIAPETRMTFHISPETAQAMAHPKCNRMSLPSAYIRDGKCDDALKASWSKDGFCIRAFGYVERDMVRKLHAAALSGDLLVSSAGSNNPFERGGLCLTILSQIPQSIHDQVSAAEVEQQKLQDAIEKTDIKDTIKNAGLNWFALKGDWSTRFKTIIRDVEDSDDKRIPRPATDHPVMFFLNPRDQGKYNSGWFTVEELEAWAQGQGPVLKKQAAA